MHKDGFSNSVSQQPSKSQELLLLQQLQQQLQHQLQQRENTIQQLKETTLDPIKRLILSQNLILIIQQIQYTNEQINLNMSNQNNIYVYQQIIKLREQQINLQLELLRQIIQARISTLTPAMVTQTETIQSIESNIKSLYNNIHAS